MIENSQEKKEKNPFLLNSDIDSNTTFARFGIKESKHLHKKWHLVNFTKLFAYHFQILSVKYSELFPYTYYHSILQFYLLY